MLQAAATGPLSSAELMEAVGRTALPTNRRRYIKPLIDAGPLVMSMPDKPRSPAQRYTITDAGHRLLASTTRTDSLDR